MINNSMIGIKHYQQEIYDILKQKLTLLHDFSAEFLVCKWVEKI